MELTKAKQVLNNSGIDLTADEQVLALIDANTHANFGRSANNVYKCLALIAGGTPFKTASRLTGIHRATIQNWRAKEWYSQAIELIRKQLDEQLDGRMTYVLNKGLNRVEQRLDAGDPVVQRDGSIIYKPVTAKDSAIISSIFFDKRNLLRNKPTSITSSQSTDERLTQLAERFKEIATVDGDFYEVETPQSAKADHGDFYEIEVDDNVQRLPPQTNEDNPSTDGRELEISIPKQTKNSKSQKGFTFTDTL